MRPLYLAHKTVKTQSNALYLLLELSEINAKVSQRKW